MYGRGFSTANSSRKHRERQPALTQVTQRPDNNNAADEVRAFAMAALAADLGVRRTQDRSMVLDRSFTAVVRLARSAREPVAGVAALMRHLAKAHELEAAMAERREVA